MPSRIEKCFLCSATSDQVVVHDLVVFDAGSNSSDRVYVCDQCFNVVCSASDERVAYMWRAFSRVESTGYTDQAFIKQLYESSSNLTLELHWVEVQESQQGFLVLITPPLMFGVNDIRLWQFSQICPQRLEQACGELGVPMLARPFNDDLWYDDRYRIEELAKRKERSRSILDALWINAKTQWGDPPDLFSAVLKSETNVSFELLRRELF